jgi:hypothetical protein
MSSILKVDQIQTAAGGTPTAADLGLNVSGSVLQVKNVVMTGIFSNSSAGSYVLVGDGTNSLQLSITVSSATNKVILYSNINSHAHNRQGGAFVVIRGSSYNSSNVVSPPTSPGSRSITNIGDAWTGDGEGDDGMMMNISSILNDTPGVGTHTYGIYCTTLASTQGGTRVNAAATDGDVDNQDYLRAVSTFTLMEIAG